MYSEDVRARISDYDRMRTQDLRVKNLLKKSQKIKKQLRAGRHRSPESSHDIGISRVQTMTSLSPRRIKLSPRKRGLSSSPTRLGLRKSPNYGSYRFLNPAEFG